MSKNNNSIVSKKRGSTRGNSKAKTGRERKKTTLPKQSQQQREQQQLERKQIYEFQQHNMIKRFPTRLSDREEIDRLKVCVAQCLAVMDLTLEYWERGECMFTAPHPNRPSKPEPQPATTTIQQPPTTEITKPNNRPNHPYL